MYQYHKAILVEIQVEWPWCTYMYIGIMEISTDLKY